MTDKIVFLTYVPRSGSTLLAQMLCNGEGVEVTPEADFPDGLLRPELVLQTDQEAHCAVNRLREDEKFASWPISFPDIEQRLQTLTLPAKFADWFPHILDAAFDLESNIVVFKCADYILHVEKLRELFPGCRFVHIMRDPRAVYVSRRNALNSKTGRPMTKSPYTTARFFNMVARQVQTYQEAPFFCLVKYEDLVSRPSEELRRLGEFLGVQPDSEAETDEETYAERIPEKQRHLHENITKPPDPSKIDAWKDEISPYASHTISRVCEGYLPSFGYETNITPSPSPPGAFFYYILSRLTSVIERANRKLRHLNF